MRGHGYGTWFFKKIVHEKIPIQPVPNTAPLPSSYLAGASQDDSEPTEFLTLLGFYRKYPGGRPQQVPNESDLDIIRTSSGVAAPSATHSITLSSSLSNGTY